MENIKERFISFFIKAILPNKKGYTSWINDNIDLRLSEIETQYENAFGKSPFLLDLSDRNSTIEYIKINQKDKSKQEYNNFNQKSGSGIPNAIINTHLINFIEFYYQDVEFESLQQLVDRLHQNLDATFCKNFQTQRMQYNGQSRISSASKIFGTVRDNYWTINVGAEKEIQYHLFFDKEKIGYGLAFNAQPSINNTNPIEEVKPFINSFLNNHNIKTILGDYSYIENDENMLLNISLGNFVCFGKTIQVEIINDDTYSIPGLSFLEMVYDIKNKQYEAYKLIWENKLTQNEKNTLIMKHIDLLKYKKQIILQGPPGTGKTRKAKLIAKELIQVINEISEKEILDNIFMNQSIDSVGGKTKYIISEIDPLLEKIKIKRESETEDYTSFTDIVDAYKLRLWESKIEQNPPRRAASIAKYIYDKINNIEKSDQYKLIQFHPSYSYEDFVRGIEANPMGNTVEYKSVNKTLGNFAQLALNNYLDSKKEPETISKEEITNELFNEFVDELTEKVETNPIELTPNVTIVSVDDSAFRYKGKDGWSDLGNRMSFKDIKQAYNDGNTIRQDLKKNQNVSGLARQHASYFIRILNMFQLYVKENSDKFKSDITNKKVEVELKNYVLIIDEINRANLSSVLGELIYALEYRGESVESMYAVDGKNELILPPNLYIIGTMNTADRSVGHIDYAMRRRFAFVDMLPEELSDTDEIYFNKEDFNKVSALFNSTNISSEFKIEDVKIGHSYFIAKKEDAKDEIQRDEIFKMKMNYEVIPILLEYEKDGVLIKEFDGKKIKDYILSLRID